MSFYTDVGTFPREGDYSGKMPRDRHIYELLYASSSSTNVIESLCFYHPGNQ